MSARHLTETRGPVTVTVTSDTAINSAATTVTHTSRRRRKGRSVMNVWWTGPTVRSVTYSERPSSGDSGPGDRDLGDPSSQCHRCQGGQHGADDRRHHGN